MSLISFVSFCSLRVSPCVTIKKVVWHVHDGAVHHKATSGIPHPLSEEVQRILGDYAFVSRILAWLYDAGTVVIRGFYCCMVLLT